jgi:hypothetical protein
MVWLRSHWHNVDWRSKWVLHDFYSLPYWKFKPSFPLRISMMSPGLGYTKRWKQRWDINSYGYIIADQFPVLVEFLLCLVVAPLSPAGIEPNVDIKFFS